jgi:hypothetical protein
MASAEDTARLVAESISTSGTCAHLGLLLTVDPCLTLQATCTVGRDQRPSWGSTGLEQCHYWSNCRELAGNPATAAAGHCLHQPAAVTSPELVSIPAARHMKHQHQQHCRKHGSNWAALQQTVSTLNHIKSSSCSAWAAPSQWCSWSCPMAKQQQPHITAQHL